MRYKFTQPKDQTLWHKWFVWFPIFINSECVWLQYVERRYIKDMYIDIDMYGSMFDVGGYEYRICEEDIW